MIVTILKAGEVGQPKIPEQKIKKMVMIRGKDVRIPIEGNDVGKAISRFHNLASGLKGLSLICII